MSLPTPTPQNRAVVTGASSGIGAALADGLACRGYSLILVARRTDRLYRLADRLTNCHHVSIEIRGCDLTDRNARIGLAEEMAGRDVAMLCNNAGFGTFGDLAQLDPQREISEVTLNCVAVHEFTLAVLPGMLARNAGAILLTGSTAGNQLGPGNATYAATKAFVNTLAESLHTELSGTGVTCTLLAPGPVRTEFGDVAELSSLLRLLPNPLLITAPQAAEAALTGVAKNKRRVVAGAFGQAQTVSGHYIPRSLIGPVLRALYRKIAR